LTEKKEKYSTTIDIFSGCGIKNNKLQLMLFGLFGIKIFSLANMRGTNYLDE
jgi:hypothetical protein